MFDWFIDPNMKKSNQFSWFGLDLRIHQIIGLVLTLFTKISLTDSHVVIVG